MVESIARVRHIRVTPMKARRVVNLIRGKQAQEALAILKFAPQGASEPVYKLVASAIANARVKADATNTYLDEQDLYITRAFVDEGTTHGWAVARLLEPGGEIGRIWTVRRALVYRAIAQLLDLGGQAVHQGSFRWCLLVTRGGDSVTPLRSRRWRRTRRPARRGRHPLPSRLRGRQGCDARPAAPQA